MGFLKNAGTYLSGNEQTTIHYYVYTPSECPPKAIVQLSHGMCEFVERYEEFARFLADHGVILCGNDHLGHGASAETLEELGFFGSENGGDQLVEDLEKLRLIMRKRYPRLPYILFGHSMGSFIARAYIVRYKNAVDGAILCGTSGGDVPIGLALRLSKLIVRFKGERYRSEWLKNVASKGYNSHFRAENDPFSWLTKEKAVRQAYAANERCNFTFTARGYYDLFSLLKEVSEESWAAEVPKSLPLFVISGLDDPVGNYGKGVQLVIDSLTDAEIVDLSVKLYPDCRHELLNETERETIYSDILSWIEKVREGVVECSTYRPYGM